MRGPGLGRRSGLGPGRGRGRGANYVKRSESLPEGISSLPTVGQSPRIDVNSNSTNFFFKDEMEVDQVEDEDDSLDVEGVSEEEEMRFEAVKEEVVESLSKESVVEETAAKPQEPIADKTVIAPQLARNRRRKVL